MSGNNWLRSRTPACEGSMSYADRVDWRPFTVPMALRRAWGNCPICQTPFILRPNGQVPRHNKREEETT